MSGTQQHDWPNRKADILGATVPICVLSVVVLAWRIVYGIHSKRRLFYGDYLLILAAVSDEATQTAQLCLLTPSC